MEPDLICVWREPCGTRFRPRGSLGRAWKTMRVLTKSGHMDMAGRKRTGWFPWLVATAAGSQRSWPDSWSYEEVAMAIRRRVPSDNPVSQHKVSLDSVYLCDMPHLVEHLSSRAYDDGAVRTPGTMILSTLGVVWKLVLKDPDSRQQLQIIAQTVDEVLIAAEAALGAVDAPWEPDPWAKQTGAKKSGK